MADSTPDDVLSGEARWCVVHGDCIDTMRSMSDSCVDAIVTDAPYGLSKITTKDVTEALECWLAGQAYLKRKRGFMGRTWDRFVPGPEVWSECLRILKPGGYLLTFSGTRTEDLMGISLRLAGFELLDTIQWLYGQGMPKSVNMERMVAMHQCTLPGRHCASTLPKARKPGDHLCPSTEESMRWSGQGSGLRPSHEPIFVCRKPLEGTYAENALAHGTGTLNIDACRIEHASKDDFEQHRSGVEAIRARGGEMENSWKNASDLSGASEVTSGRWPPNVLIQHAPGCRLVGTRSVAANPAWDTPNRDTQPSSFTGSSVSKVRHTNGRENEVSGDKSYQGDGSTSFAFRPGQRRDQATEDIEVWECVDGCPAKALGDRARYFPQFASDEPEFLYHAKPGRAEKDAGLKHFRTRSAAEATARKDEQVGLKSARAGAGGARNVHPTSKSVDVIRWLTRLVARPGQVVFNPFAGGGSEGIAAMREGCRWIGCELNDTDEEPFVSIARARLTHEDGGSYVPRESLRAEPEKSPRQGKLF